MKTQSFKVAIMGSGPSGCYTAQFLKKYLPNSDIAVFEKLPVPFGLARYGIASDHQGSKGIINQFDRLFKSGEVKFLGNINIGTTISKEEIIKSFDIIINATGISKDKDLFISGNKNNNLIGAGDLLKSLNSYPSNDFKKISPLGKSIVIIGNGNVAIDCARLISKRDEDLIGSDIMDDVRRQLKTSDVEEITLIGRSNIDKAKFDLSMLKELCNIPYIEFSHHGISNKTSCPAIDIIDQSQKNKTEKTIKIRFIFNSSPVKIMENNRRKEILINNNADKKSLKIKCDSVISAIGFEHGPSDVKIECNNSIFSVGWAKNGAKGTVASARKDAQEIVKKIIKKIDEGKIKALKKGLESLDQNLINNSIDYHKWKKIDNYELINADSSRCRKKITSTEEMIRIANS